MYCRNCGNLMEEQTKFCPQCGTGTGSRMEVEKDTAPVWESVCRTVRCEAPHFELVSDVLRKYEAFGWELVSSQEVCQNDIDTYASGGRISVETRNDRHTNLNRNDVLFSLHCASGECSFDVIIETEFFIIV